MAEYLASIFGTEKDKVNCSFYFKIGACRHGDRCSRIHNKPTFSQTILLQNLYHNPANVTQNAEGQPIPGMPQISEAAIQEHFDNFFEDVFVELEDKYGEIEEMNVCDNLGDHLVGNVYVKFKREEDAEKAVNDLNNRWFAGRPIYAELSPVTDFREACCRQYEMGECTRSGFCNFMHLKPISRDLRRELYGRKGRPGGSGGGRRSRSRSRSRKRETRTRSRSKSPHERTRKRSRDREREKRDKDRSSRRRSSRERSPRPDRNERNSEKHSTSGDRSERSREKVDGGGNEKDRNASREKSPRERSKSPSSRRSKRRSSRERDRKRSREEKQSSQHSPGDKSHSPPPRKRSEKLNSPVN